MTSFRQWVNALGRETDRFTGGWLSRLKAHPVGFRIDEVMTGQHRFEPGFGPEGYHFFEFAITWGPDRIIDWLNPRGERFLWQELEGVVRAGGLCEQAPCRGTLELNYFGERRIRYSFDFVAAGTTYHYLGEKVNIRPWNLPISHTTCFGHLTEKETGKLVSTSLTFFRLHRAPRFLSSFRLLSV